MPRPSTYFRPQPVANGVVTNLAKPPALASCMGSFDFFRLRLSALRMTVEKSHTPSRQPARCRVPHPGKFPCVALRPLWLDKALMKYCRFEHNGGEQYGLVESVAG